MPTFDLHQHLWPDQLIERLEARTRPPFLEGSVLTTTEGSFAIDLGEHHLDRRLDALDAAGIDIAVVSLQPTLGFEALQACEREPLVRAYHDGIAALAAASRGRLRALAAGTFRPGFDGVCVGASQLLYPDGLAHLLDPLERSGGFLFVHPDDEPQTPIKPEWWTSVTGYTARMQSAYLAWIDRGQQRWPDLKVVFALLAGGAPFQLERLRSRGVDTRRVTAMPVYLETSSYGRLALELCLSVYGVERLVFGSDFPVLPPATTMSAIRALGKATTHAILSANPESLFPRSGGLRDGSISDEPRLVEFRAARPRSGAWPSARPLAEPGPA